MEPMSWMELMEQRHSVRQYQALPIEAQKRAILDETVAQINQESGLHVQMIYDEPTCFRSLMAHYGKFSGVENYIALVGKKKKAPKLEETLGYYGEKLVLKAQELGLNTCWVALTHGKPRAVVEKDEKLVCLISLGYGVTQGVPHKSKPIEEISPSVAHAPEWFLTGLRAALLAPTAMNQQKFTISLRPDETVFGACGSGFYTKLDLGIVKYHFELASGRTMITDSEKS